MALTSQQKLDVVKERFNNFAPLQDGRTAYQRIAMEVNLLVPYVREYLEEERLNRNHMMATFGFSKSRFDRWEKIYEYPYLRLLAERGHLTSAILDKWHKVGSPKAVEEGPAKLLDLGFPVPPDNTVHYFEPDAGDGAQAPALLLAPYAQANQNHGAPAGANEDVRRVIVNNGVAALPAGMVFLKSTDQDFPLKDTIVERDLGLLLDDSLPGEGFVRLQDWVQAHQHFTLYVVVDAARMVSFVCVDIRANHLIRAYATDNRFRRRGLARYLLNRVMDDYARKSDTEKGVKTLSANIYNHDHRSRDLMRSVAEEHGREAVLVGQLTGDGDRIIPKKSYSEDALLEWHYNLKKAAKEAAKGKTKKVDTPTKQSMKRKQQHKGPPKKRGRPCKKKYERLERVWRTNKKSVSLLYHHHHDRHHH